MSFTMTLFDISKQLVSKNSTALILVGGHALKLISQGNIVWGNKDADAL